MRFVRIDLRHVEPGGGVQIVLAEITGRRGPELLPLPAVHRLPGQARAAAAAELHLHEADGAVRRPGPPDPAPRTGSATGGPAGCSRGPADSRPVTVLAPGLPVLWCSCPSGLPLLQECPPVGRAGAVLVQHFIVELRPVALVFCELILGVFPVQHVGHIPVPADLGQDGGRRDGGALPVPAHQAHVGRVDGHAAAVVPVAVDEAQVRRDGKPADGPLHRQHPGVEDVHLVDLLRRDSGHAVGDGGPR